MKIFLWNLKVLNIQKQLPVAQLSFQEIARLLLQLNSILISPKFQKLVTFIETLIQLLLFDIQIFYCLYGTISNKEHC